MACTTILVGKKASNNGSTFIARNDDCPSGQFHVKKMVVVDNKKQPRLYKAKISHVKINLPDNPLPYVMMPNVDKSEGIWGASGINKENVGMSATETITSNPRVLGADPYVKNGIGEEDLLVLVLPYIHTAKEGVLRLGALLEKYGTYEPNGIAFNDDKEVWWLETIGGHHYIAKKVKDDECVIMPNQFGLDNFDFGDAYTNKKENICSSDLKEFILENNLYVGHDNIMNNFNPRLAFGSHDDSDHVYNTPRAWYMGRYLCPKTIKWDGNNADFNPNSDDIPWSYKPEKKVTVEDIKYLLSSHYQGTPFDPYIKGTSTNKNIYRPIGINRTSFIACIEIRNHSFKENKAIEWISFGSNVYNALVPVYTNVDEVPTYFANTTLNVSTSSFYWANRLISALSDPHYYKNIVHIERYQNAVASESHRLINKYDKIFSETKDLNILNEANKEIAKMVKSETDKVLNKVLYESSMLMQNSFARSDN